MLVEDLVWVLILVIMPIFGSLLGLYLAKNWVRIGSVCCLLGSLKIIGSTELVYTEHVGALEQGLGWCFIVTVSNDQPPEIAPKRGG